MFKETEIGFELITNDFIVFFGKHNSQLSTLHQCYPYLDWTQLKQVHGSVMVQALSPEIDVQTADAHWTSSSKLVLISKTADCIPVLGFNQTTKAVISIHAGWRGLTNHITKLSLESLSSHHPKQAWKIFIGPHIQQKSFEIQQDTVDLLQQCTPLERDLWLNETSEGLKANLSLILLQQLQSCGVPQTQIHALNLDTKTDSRFHSFRRDKEISGRQLSFIAKIQ